MILPEEALFPVPRAVELATGSRPHPTTCHRWRLRGIQGLKLATVKIGGRRKTSVEAVRRWIEATTEAADGDFAQARTNRQREAAILRSEAELAAEGI